MLIPIVASLILLSPAPIPDDRSVDFDPQTDFTQFKSFALGNGVLPLRKVAQIEAERRHRLEMTQAHAMERNSVHPTAASADRRTDASGDRQRVLAAST